MNICRTNFDVIMRFLDKIITYGLCLFVFLLPWQTRWIYKDAQINGGVWEYGRLSLYGTEILLIVILILGVVRWLFQYRKMNKEERIQEIKSELKGIKLWIILLVIWSAITILWSSDKLLAWYGWLRLAEGIGLLWLITQNSKFKIQNLGIILVASGVVQSLLAIWQWVAQWSFSSKWLGMAYLNPATFGVSIIDNGVGRFLRAYGSLSHPNILAGFLVVCLLLTLIMIINEQSKKVVKLLFGVLAILTMGLFLTFSRAGWLTLFVCLFVYLIIYLLKKVRIRRLLWSVLLIIFVFGTLSWFYADLVKTRVVSEQRLEVQSNQERINAYSQAWSIIKEHWLTGVGLSHYTLALYQKNPVQEAWAYQPVHDAGLLTWAELGIVGLILFILIIISAFRYKSKFCLLLIVILLLGLFDHYFRSLYFGVMLWWLILTLSYYQALEKH